MSRKLVLSKLNQQERNTISQDLKITVEPTKYAYNAPPKIIYPLIVEDEHVYVPFAYKTEYDRPSRDTFPIMNTSFEGELRENQQVVFKEAIKVMNIKGSILLALHTGFGKTICAINMACRIKLRTLIVTHRIVLINQWKSSILKVCPNARISIVSSANKELGDFDFFIINASLIPKKPRDFFLNIGTVIVDEAHIIMAERLSSCMLQLLPRYVIGLSATPYRTDGLNMLFDLYFGPTKIERKMYHEHQVYRINSNFEPEVELGANGKVNWNSIIDSQSYDVERNEIIVKLVNLFPERVFLILTKRVAQAKHLIKRLTENGEDVTSLVGKQQTYQKLARILVGTCSKAGVGFDHDRLDTLLLASDLEQYFIQYLGRIFRRKDVKPIIFDIVDKNPILLKHYKTREKIYIEHGGSIRNFKMTDNDVKKVKILSDLIVEIKK